MSTCQLSLLAEFLIQLKSIPVPCLRVRTIPIVAVKLVSICLLMDFEEVTMSFKITPQVIRYVDAAHTKG